jgi:hypothetical protein
VSRLLVHVEGQTEETFVKEVLAPHLFKAGYELVRPRLLGNARQRINRGGARSWVSVCSEIVRHLKEDSSSLATTMVDYYGLPESGQGAWPGRSAARGVGLPEKADIVETAVLADVSDMLPDCRVRERFIPFIVMHEFEGLLFSDCRGFSEGIGHPELAPQFQAIRDEFGNPEEINDSPRTAPSKRVVSLVPGYEKPLFGALAMLHIGIDVIRSECPHFRGWLERLEAAVAQT